MILILATASLPPCVLANPYTPLRSGLANLVAALLEPAGGSRLAWGSQHAISVA
jgi:hypothetical protein